MKKFLVILLMLPFFAHAQTVGVKDIDADGDTTIEIKKGKNSQKEYEIVTNEDEISGDSAPLLKDARTNWKEACKEWKTETKGLNKEGQILSLNCGKMECSTSAMENVCQSNAKSKIRVAVDE